MPRSSDARPVEVRRRRCAPSLDDEVWKFGICQALAVDAQFARVSSSPWRALRKTVTAPGSGGVRSLMAAR